MTKFLMLLIAGAVMSGCEVLGVDDGPAEASFTSTGGLRVTIEVDPGEMHGREAFKVRTSVTNTSNTALTVSVGGLQATTGDSAVSMHSLQFLRNGAAANNQFAGTGPSCLNIRGTAMPGQRLAKTLQPGAQLFILGTCEMSFEARTGLGDSPTPAGAYRIRYAGDIRVEGSTPEAVPPLEVEFHVTD